jgi:hypothetical protein
VNRYFTILQSQDLVRVDVNADDMMTDIGKTCSGDQTYISGAKDRYVHSAQSPTCLGRKAVARSWMFPCRLPIGGPEPLTYIVL